ncbi:MAG: dephospho-CoA kinase [Flavobacteriales bacterium]|nr:dephospho-CoA kinase [Flavobacteriales bacterium]
MLKIGLTGGIGSGKTTVAKIFKQLGIPVYLSDDRAKALMLENESLRKSLIGLFGEQAYVDGVLNRAYLASIVFSNDEALTKLNELVHPILQKDFELWSSHQQSPYIIKEAAILLESGANKGLDKVVLVEAPKELKISRVVQRDHVEYEDVLARMNKQWTDSQKREHSDYVISNDEKSSLLEQVLKLHDIFSDQ